MNYDWFLERELYRHNLEREINERQQEELEHEQYELEDDEA